MRIEKDISWVRGLIAGIGFSAIGFLLVVLKNWAMWKLGYEVDLLPPFSLGWLVCGMLLWHLILIAMGMPWRDVTKKEVLTADENRPKSMRND